MRWLLPLILLVGCTSPDGETPDTDVETRSYLGGWPVRADRDTVPMGSWDQAPRVGRIFPPFTGVDQYGEEVHLADFAGEGPVMIDVSTGWCGICRETATWLAGGEDPSADRKWPDVPDKVDAGELRWITVLVENDFSQPATADDARAWHEDHPHDRIPVLEDGDAQVSEWARLYGYPQLFLLDDALRIQVATRGYTDALDAAQEGL